MPPTQAYELPTDSNATSGFDNVNEPSQVYSNEEDPTDVAQLSAKEDATTDRLDESASVNEGVEQPFQHEVDGQADASGVGQALTLENSTTTGEAEEVRVPEVQGSTDELDDLGDKATTTSHSDVPTHEDAEDDIEYDVEASTEQTTPRATEQNLPNQEEEYYDAEGMWQVSFTLA